MKIITIPKERSVKYETGNAFRVMKDGKIEETKDVKDIDFFEFVEILLGNTAEFGKGGAKGAKRARKIQRELDLAEAEGLEVLKFEDADYDALIKTHREVQTWPPKAAMVMVEWFEAFESPLDQTGPVAPRKTADLAEVKETS